MQNKYAVEAGSACRWARLGLLGIGLGLAGSPATLMAWSRASHGALAARAVKGAPAFSAYATDRGLVDRVVKGVQDADNESEKVFTADLAKTHAGIRMITGDDPSKVQHTSPILAYFLPDDTRLHNALECLKIAHGLRRVAATPAEHEAAMRIFADGLHLVQDYFAHLNAPGRGQTGFAHGVGNPVDTDGDGKPDLPAGRVVDNVFWDCHSDHGNELVPAHLRVINYFHSPFWHKHANKDDSWRYQAALAAGIEYMECYLADDGPARFRNMLAAGYVAHRDRRVYLDLITHLAADNADAACALVGEWATATAPGALMDGYARASVKATGTSATWSFTAPLTGNYDVYLRWPAQAQLTSAARVTIHDGRHSTERSVDQSGNGNRWNRQGRFAFAKDAKISVALTAAPGELLAADAVLLVRVPD